MRKGRPPPPPIDDDDEDNPPAIPERKYKHRGGSLEKKEDKNRAANADRENNKRHTIGYADIDPGSVVHEPHNQIPNQIRTDYAHLAYPTPDNDLGADNGEGSTTNGNMFAEICSNDEATSYDFPLPILSDKRNNTPFKENGVAGSAGSLEPVADPFADDPFEQCDKSKDSQVKSDFVKGPLVVALPPLRSQSYNAKAAHRIHDNKSKHSSSPRTFTKARSTDDVLDDPVYSTVRTAGNSYGLGMNRNSSSELYPDKTLRPALVSRNSWAGAEAKSYSNPTYSAKDFDPSKLEAHEDGHRRPPRLPDDGSNLDAMQFYEEDFTILQAQGYTREEITRALIVAENNFAMARKILREFSQGTRKL